MCLESGFQMAPNRQLPDNHNAVIICQHDVIHILFTLLCSSCHIQLLAQISCQLHYWFWSYQGLIQKIGAASDIGQKGHFFGKKGTKSFITLYSISFLSVSHRNKALQNFYRRGQRPIVGRTKGLDQGLVMAIYMGLTRNLGIRNTPIKFLPNIW